MLVNLKKQKRWKSIGLAIGVIFFISGCAQIPEGTSEANIKSLDDFRAKQSLKGTASQWPKDLWWKAYADPQLNALIQEGLENSPSMAIAESRLRRAQSITKISRAALKPVVSGNAAATMEKHSYNYLTPSSSVPKSWNDYGVASLNFEWEIDFWGKNKSALEAAISAQQASEADMAQARLTLSSSIAHAYGELARLYILRDTAKSAVSMSTKTYDLLDKRYDFGLETRGRVKQAQSIKAVKEEAVLALDEQIAIQRNRISMLLGAGPDRGLTITPPTLDPTKTFTLPKDIKLELLGRRPDIVASRLRVVYYEKMIDKQKAAFYPNVNLSAVIGVQSFGLNMLGESGSDFGSVGPVVSLPIFNGGRLKNQLRQAESEYDEAVNTYNQTLTQALQEVADAAISQRSLSKKIEKLQIAVDAATEAHRFIKDRYEGGLENYLNVLSVEEVLIENLRALRELQSRSFTLDISLIKALGGGYQVAPKN